MRRGRRIEGTGLRGPVACAVVSIAALSLGPAGTAWVRSAVRDLARQVREDERLVPVLLPVSGGLLCALRK